MLLGGAELFTDNAVRAARALRISTLALGLIFAGAEPEELFTAAIASAREAPGISLGNLVGTNITIIALALGLAAVIVPIRVQRATWRYGAITLAATLPAIALLLWGRVPLWGGAVLVASYFVYILHVVYRERQPLEVAETSVQRVAGELATPAGLGNGGAHRPSAWRRALPAGLVLVSLAVMGGGGHFTVEGARDLATWLGMSESAIGLSIVAFATSAEMLFLAVVPALKGHPEISLGGILGSYAFNLTLGLGIAALIAPLVAPERRLVALSALFMLGLLVLLLLLAGKGTLKRRDGLLLVALYAAFLALLFAVL